MRTGRAASIFTAPRSAEVFSWSNIDGSHQRFDFCEWRRGASHWDKHRAADPWHAGNTFGLCLRKKNGTVRTPSGERPMLALRSKKRRTSISDVRAPAWYAFHISWAVRSLPLYAGRTPRVRGCAKRQTCHNSLGYLDSTACEIACSWNQELAVSLARPNVASCRRSGTHDGQPQRRCGWSQQPATRCCAPATSWSGRGEASAATLKPWYRRTAIDFRAGAAEAGGTGQNQR